MYHCHIHFYLTGHACRVFDLIKELASMENYTYSFIESEKPEGAFIARADVVLANLQDMDIKET